MTLDPTLSPESFEAGSLPQLRPWSRGDVRDEGESKRGNGAGLEDTGRPGARICKCFQRPEKSRRGCSPASTFAVAQ